MTVILAARSSREYAEAGPGYKDFVKASGAERKIRGWMGRRSGGGHVEHVREAGQARRAELAAPPQARARRITARARARAVARSTARRGNGAVAISSPRRARIATDEPEIAAKLASGLDRLTADALAPADPYRRTASRRTWSRRRVGADVGRAAGSILRRRLAMWARSTCVSSPYPEPHTEMSSSRWVISRPRLRASRASRPNSVGVRWISSRRGARRGGRGRPEPSAEITPARLRRGPAQVRLQPRDQLARAERLGHVIVGPGRQRADLRVLVADRGQDDQRDVGPFAQPPAELDPVTVGQHEVDDRGVRRLTAATSSASSAVEAGSASNPASRRITRSARRICVLVVADEHLRRGALASRRRLGGDRAGRRLGSATGSETTKLVPWPGATRPRSCRRWPRRTLGDRQAEPRARPRPGSALRSAIERLEDPLALGRRNPGPRSTTLTSTCGRFAGRGPRRLAAASSVARSRAGSRTRARAARRRPAPGTSGSITSRTSRSPPPSRAARSTSSSDTQSDGARRSRPRGARGRAASPRARRAGWPSPTTAALSSVRSSAVSDDAPSAWPAATIAVSGVRRSCDTARSSAVLMSSDRRSASVSTASACSASRLNAIATSASSAGTTRSRRRSIASAGRPARDEQRCELLAVPVAEPERAPPFVAVDRAQLDRRRRYRERLRQPPGGAGRAPRPSPIPRAARARARPRGRPRRVAARPRSRGREPARRSSRRRSQSPRTRPARPSCGCRRS